MAVAIRKELDDDSALAQGRELCELSAHIQAALAELALRAAAFDSATSWAGDGIRSCPHWLSINAGLDLHTSADLLRVGHALADLPLLREAFRAGQLSLDKIRAVLRVATPVDEELMLELALNADASQLVRICREIRRSMDADAPGQADQMLAKRGLWTRMREDGMLRLVALLPPEDGAAVVGALEAIARSDALPKPDRTVPDPADDPWAARRLDALKLACENALAAGPEALVTAPDTVQTVVHVDVGILTGEQADGLCHLEDGTPLSRAVAQRLSCDADVIAITERDGLPIDVGRKKRLFTDKQRRAMHARDRTCRYPGCPVPASRCRGHHIDPWWSGGKTNLSNGLSLCDFHHGRLHDGEYHIRRDEAGEIHFETAAGVEIKPPHREPLDLATGGLAHLRDLHAEQALTIVPETPLAGWGGERCSVLYVADVYAEASEYRRTQAARAP